jgi:hypothetical protein
MCRNNTCFDYFARRGHPCWPFAPGTSARPGGRYASPIHDFAVCRKTAGPTFPFLVQFKEAILKKRTMLGQGTEVRYTSRLSGLSLHTPSLRIAKSAGVERVRLDELQHLPVDKGPL